MFISFKNIVFVYSVNITQMKRQIFNYSKQKINNMFQYKDRYVNIDDEKIVFCVKYSRLLCETLIMFNSFWQYVDPIS